MNLAKTPLMFAAVLLMAAPTVQARTWTQAGTGKTLEGELRQYQDDKAQIVLSNGKSLEIPVAMLSDEDKAFIAEWQKSNGPAGEASAAAGTSELPALPAEGPVELTLAGAHLCCGGCRKAVEGTIEGLTGVEIDASGDDIVIKAEDAKLALDVAERVADAGFYGTPSHAIGTPRAAAVSKVKEQEFTGVHLCCGKCTRAVKAALDSVEGVESYEVEDKADVFTATGDFLAADVIAALNAQGMHAKAK